MFRRLGIDVTTTPEAGLLHATDEEQLAFAAADGRVIITHDQDFLALAAATSNHAGVCYCHQSKYTLGGLIDAVHLVWAVYQPEEMRDWVEYL